MSENKFTEKMQAHSDEELREIIENRSKYVPEALEAALAELETRGIDSDALMQESQDNAMPEEPKSDYWNRAQQVEDESAPLLYSKRAVYGFSFGFSVLFGAALMVINFRTLRKPEAVVPTVSFALAFMATTLFVSGILEAYFSIPVLLSNIVCYAGAWLLLKVSWEKYIGNDLKYRKKGIIKPAIVGIAIFVLFFFAVFIFVYGWAVTHHGEAPLDPQNAQQENPVNFNDVAVPSLRGVCNSVIRAEGSGCPVYYDSTAVSLTDAKGAGAILEMVGYFNRGQMNDLDAFYFKQNDKYIIAFGVSDKALNDMEIERILKQGIRELEKTYANRKYQFRMISLDSPTGPKQREIEAD